MLRQEPYDPSLIVARHFRELPQSCLNFSIYKKLEIHLCFERLKRFKPSFLLRAGAIVVWRHGKKRADILGRVKRNFIAYTLILRQFKAVKSVWLDLVFVWRVVNCLFQLPKVVFARDSHYHDSVVL